MPVHVFVSHVLRVQSYLEVAELALVSEVLLVAWNAARVVVGEHVSLSREDGVAVPAAEVMAVPVLGEGLGVLPRENQLVAGAAARLQVLGVVALAVHVVVEDAVC